MRKIASNKQARVVFFPKLANFLLCSTNGMPCTPLLQNYTQGISCDRISLVNLLTFDHTHTHAHMANHMRKASLVATKNCTWTGVFMWCVRHICENHINNLWNRNQIIAEIITILAHIWVYATPTKSIQSLFTFHT